MSKDFAKLRKVIDLIQPRMIVVDNAQPLNARDRYRASRFRIDLDR
jgi:hypothetical protein